MPAVTTKVAFENMLHFSGNARAALEFYRSLFGGELSIMTYGDSPMPDRPGDPPRDHVMHARLAIPGGAGVHGLRRSAGDVREAARLSFRRQRRLG